MRLFFKKQAVPVDAPADGKAFHEVLGTAEVDSEPLIDALAYVREHAHEANTLTEHYHHLDVLSAGVEKSFPASYCKAGCSGCCYYPVGLFTITFTEWDVMRRHMETVWTEAQREAFTERYERTFSGLWRFVIGYLQNSFVLLIVTAPLLSRARIACPFLDNDRCSIYAARPYQCRTFGLFAARSTGREPKVYACNIQGENLLNQLRHGGPQLQLPVMNPIVRAIRKLCSGPKLALPMWAGIWVQRRRPIAPKPEPRGD